MKILVTMTLEVTPDDIAGDFEGIASDIESRLRDCWLPNQGEVLAIKVEEC